MKTDEQIELAKETIKMLQDYTELASVCKKLKMQESKESVEEYLKNCVEVAVYHLKKM